MCRIPNSDIDSQIEILENAFIEEFDLYEAVHMPALEALPRFDELPDIPVPVLLQDDTDLIPFGPRNLNLFDRIHYPSDTDDTSVEDESEIDDDYYNLYD